MPKLIQINNLKMYYRGSDAWAKAVDDVSVEVDRGETLGIVGESGCGKTSLALSIIRILPPYAKILSGEILFDGLDLVKLSENQMRAIRWKKISYVFQNAMNSLDPMFKVGDSLVEALLAHERISHSEAKSSAEKVFNLVGLPPTRLNNYPHEFSGGMKQRALIAMSLICNPDLIIADEPTSALDVILQDQILQEIKELQTKLQLTMLIISHDMSVIAETCQKVAVMYGGKIVEWGDVADIYRQPRHPYTIGLIRSYPSIKGPLKNLVTIRGSPPSLTNPPKGCRFAPRCPIAQSICNEEVPLCKVDQNHYSLCHFAGDLKAEEVKFDGVLRR